MTAASSLAPNVAPGVAPNAAQQDPVIETDPVLALRRKLVLGYRMLGMFGLGRGLLAHLTARLPGGRTFHSYAFGQSVEEASLSTLQEADFDACCLASDGRINPTLSAHGTIYRARPDLLCVVHHHGDNAVAAGAIGVSLEAVDNHAGRWHGDVALVQDYADTFSIAEQGEIMARSFAAAKGLILQHHGLIVACGSVEEAVVRAIELEHSLGVQLKAMAAGNLITMPLPAIAECKKFLNSEAYFSGMWAYLCRRLQREGWGRDMGF